MSKLKKQNGFTLIEMLIVVAIIAILIAVSIPLVGNALERAREATDAANERALKAKLVICFLTGTLDGNGVAGADKFVPGDTYAYDAASGKLVPLGEESAKIPAYGQSTATMGIDNIKRQGLILYGTCSIDNKIDIFWYQPATAPPGGAPPDNLISGKMAATT